MRVLFLGPYPPPQGGIQTHLSALRRTAMQRGHHTEVINITRHRQKPGDGIHYPRSALGVIWLLFSRRFDVTHLHLGGHLGFRVLALALVQSLVPRSKAVLTLHSGGFPSSPEGRRLGPRSFAGFVLRRFDAVIGVNPEQTAFFERLGVAADRTHLLSPFPPVVRPASAHEPPSDALQQVVEGCDPLLVTVGLLEPEYDLQLQIRMMGEVVERHPSAGLLIIGSGSLHESLERLREEQPHRDHVHLCGDVPHERTLSIISDAAVLLRTTHYDGDAISVREALELGTPVIATDNGMRPPGVRLIPVGEGAPLVDAILSLLDEPRDGAQEAQGAPDGARSDLHRVTELYEALAGA